MAEISILLPDGEVPSTAHHLARRPHSLRGRRVGFLDNELWHSMQILTDELSKVLTEEHEVASVDVLRSGPVHGGDPAHYRDRLERWSHEVDAVISGLGN
jgi:hypothetical protein